MGRAAVPLLALLVGCAGTPIARVAEVEIGAAAPAKVAVDEPSPPPRSTAHLDGTWVEDWGVEGETDVTYHDVYELRTVSGKLTITCPDRQSYDFKKVVADGRRLDVRLENNGVIIDYSLRVEPGASRIVGRAKTNHGIDVPIVWNRRGHGQ